MTKSDIRARLTAIRTELNDCFSPTSADIERINKEIVALEKRKAVFVSELRKKLDHKIFELKLEEKRLYEQLDQLVEEQSVKLPEHIATWWKKHIGGLSGGNKYQIVWISDDEKYVVYHVPGGNCWSGIGASTYHASRYVLSDLDDRWTNGGLGQFEGRMSKSKLEELIQKIPKSS